MKTFFAITSLITLAFGSIHGQEATSNPPYPSNNPYAPRGNPRSPSGQWEWVVTTSNPVSYQLIDSTDRKTLITIKSYFADSGGPEAFRYARALGVYWNKNSNLVVLDELNYRRAGDIYFFSVQDGKAKQIEVSVPKPPDADETRLCADKSWISPTKFSVRQAIRLKGGDFQSKYYILDLADLDHPTVQLEE